MSTFSPPKIGKTIWTGILGGRKVRVTGEVLIINYILMYGKIGKGTPG